MMVQELCPMLHNFTKNNSVGLAIFVQIAPYCNHKYNKVCSILWHNFFGGKLPNFMELMLESWIFL